jgi:hypothetical protein
MYKSIITKYHKVGCVGYWDFNRISNTSTGTRDIKQADIAVSDSYQLGTMKAFALTQYGLFRASILKKYGFPIQYPFNQPGWGCEDNWFAQEFLQDGYRIVFIDTPFYYHKQHSSWSEIEKSNLSKLEQERVKAYGERWGAYNFKYKMLKRKQAKCIV